MRIYLQKILAHLARKILAKYKPQIIGVTGSVGKTSAKEAIALLVSQKYNTRKSDKNFNNEFGLPLTVIGSDSPGRNVFLWVGVIVKALGLLVFPVRYPQVLVLEMGIDRIGDMDYLLSIAKPHISVLTSIGVSHYEFFKDEKVIAIEKGKIGEVLSSKDFFVVNADNGPAMAQRSRTKAQVITYGSSSGATVQVVEFSERITQEGAFTDMTLRISGKEVKTTIRAVGMPHISSVLVAVAVSTALGIEESLIVQGLSQYRPYPGRLNIINGIQKSIIIDDTYNAAPDSMREALAVFGRTPAPYKIAVLGDMLELGDLSEGAHRDIGARVATVHPDLLITVGSSGYIMAETARQTGLSEQSVVSFNTSDQARQYVADHIQPGSLILVKGSQGVRLEKVTKDVMAEPMRASELLCRQYGKWIRN